MADNGVDYYKALKEQNYRALLDNEIQLDSARQRALKNTNAGLAAAGFNSAGYGQLSKNGIEEQYLRGLQNAQTTYQQENNNIAMQENEQKGNDFNSLLQMLDNDYVDSKETMYSVLKNYQLLDDKEQLDMDKVASLYGDEAAKQLGAIIGLKENGFGSNNETIANYTFAEAKTNIVDNNGEVGKLNDELDFLYGKGSQLVPAKEGTMLLVKGNTSAGSNYAYLVFKNGAWRQTDTETYHSAPQESRYELYSGKNTHDWFYVKNNGKETKYASSGKLYDQQQKEQQKQYEEALKKNGKYF